VPLAVDLVLFQFERQETVQPDGTDRRDRADSSRGSRHLAECALIGQLLDLISKCLTSPPKRHGQGQASMQFSSRICEG
jgi:hypothetical protein